jgi:hypothetical protein
MTDAPWLCEFLLNEHEGEEWVYRRHPAVRMPLAEVGIVTPDGLPVLAPQIVLLFKAYDLTAEAGAAKAEADFRAALPHLAPSARAWLVEALDESLPDHPWTARLRG